MIAENERMKMEVENLKKELDYKRKETDLKMKEIEVAKNAEINQIRINKQESELNMREVERNHKQLSIELVELQEKFFAANKEARKSREIIDNLNQEMNDLLNPGGEWQTKKSKKEIREATRQKTETGSTSESKPTPVIAKSSKNTQSLAPEMTNYTKPNSSGNDPDYLDQMMFARDYSRNDTVYFRGKKDWMSNFYPCTVTIGGKSYKDSETPYHITKSVLLDMAEVGDEIENAKSASHAKEIANEKLNPVAEGSDLWNDLKVDVMHEILEAKLDSNPQMKTWLLQTGKRYLVEDVFEDFWGVGKEGKGGLNMLGKLWMRIRASLPPPPKSPSSTPLTAQTNPSYKSMLIAPAQKDSRARPDRNKTKADTAPFTLLIGNSQLYFGTETPGGVQMRMRSAHVTGTSFGLLTGNGHGSRTRSSVGSVALSGWNFFLHTPVISGLCLVHGDACAVAQT